MGGASIYQSEKGIDVPFLQGSLIHQILDDGTLYGVDYDGRLGILMGLFVDWNPFAGNIILDLGSNAGHFPIEYIRMGAKEVIAVEGRQEFEKQWQVLKNHLPGIDSGRIKWNCADVREFKTDEKYNIISCLGLVYHVNEIWPHLKRLTIPEVGLIIIESDLVPSKGVRMNYAHDPTHALEDGEVRQYTAEGIQEIMQAIYPEWELYRMMFFDHNLLVGNDPKLKESSRGIWFLKRK